MTTTPPKIYFTQDRWAVTRKGLIPVTIHFELNGALSCEGGTATGYFSCWVTHKGSSRKLDTLSVSDTHESVEKALKVSLDQKQAQIEDWTQQLYDNEGRVTKYRRSIKKLKGELLKLKQDQKKLKEGS